MDCTAPWTSVQASNINNHAYSIADLHCLSWSSCWCS